MTIIDTTPRAARKALAAAIVKALDHYDPNQCARKCPGKRPCCLSPGVYHLLHVCSEPECECHGRERYEGESHE